MVDFLHLLPLPRSEPERMHLTMAVIAHLTVAVIMDVMIVLRMFRPPDAAVGDPGRDGWVRVGSCLLLWRRGVGSAETGGFRMWLLWYRGWLGGRDVGRRCQHADQRH